MHCQCQQGFLRQGASNVSALAPPLHAWYGAAASSTADSATLGTHTCRAAARICVLRAVCA